MAYRLSFRRMTRSGQDFFARASTLLGLLLAMPLVFAEVVCATAPGLEASALWAASQDRCSSASAAADACAVNAQRIDIRVAASASSSSPEPTPAGLAPAAPSPVYILLRRYLS
ncbi:MAG: hypothetical protein ACRD5W_03005 [Candidatus Acidiferrales bacterium]